MWCALYNCLCYVIAEFEDAAINSLFTAIIYEGAGCNKYILRCQLNFVEDILLTNRVRRGGAQIFFEIMQNAPSDSLTGGEISLHLCTGSGGRHHLFPFSVRICCFNM